MTARRHTEPPRRRSRGLGLAVVLAGPLLMGSWVFHAQHAHGKEPSAACASIDRLLQQADMTLALARQERDRGSGLGAQNILITSLKAMVGTAVEESCGVVAGILTTALERARHADDAVAATLALDLGLSAFRSLAWLGVIAGDDLGAKQVTMAEAAYFGVDCPDLYRITQQLDQPVADLAVPVRAILSDLNTRPRCPVVVKELQAALATEDAETLALAVDNVRLDTRPQSQQTTSWGYRCPELPTIVDRLQTAIRIGAPLYNRGDHTGCHDEYLRTTDALLTDTIPKLRCPRARQVLHKGRDEAAKSTSVSDAAWALRRAFDRIIGMDQAPDPKAPSPYTGGTALRFKGASHYTTTGRAP